MKGHKRIIHCRRCSSNIIFLSGLDGSEIRRAIYCSGYINWIIDNTCERCKNAQSLYVV